MNPAIYSWMHPALVVRETGRYGLGLFTDEDLTAGTELLVCGGPVLSLSDEDRLPSVCRDKPIELSEWFSMGPRSEGDIPRMPQLYLNHSCRPNAGWKGQLTLVAMRDIAAGEEITHDYGMVAHSNCHSASYWTMQCRCGCPNCRELVTEDDWQRPELQSRYDGWFAWHIQRKLDARRRGTDLLQPLVATGRTEGWNWVDHRIGSSSFPGRGRGLVALADLPIHTLVVALGGRIMSLADETRDLGIQISARHVLGPREGEASLSDHINHLCEPNLGFFGQVFLITLRDVRAGEELGFDYATCVGGVMPYRMPCRCGARTCRGEVTHEDWRRPDLRRRLGALYQPWLREGRS